MELARKIDHTFLKPDANQADIKRVCVEAVEHKFWSVCVSPYYVVQAVKLLEDLPVKVATVIGFPMGYSPTVAKVEEIKRALTEGVDELDVVVNVSAVKSGDWSHVRNDIDSMTRAVHLKGKVIKVILESGLMTSEELKKLCVICGELGVDYVKTSTGFSDSGATVEAVELMRKQLPASVKIKASGGIKTTAQAKKLVEAGADRIGSSSSIKLIGKK